MPPFKNAAAISWFFALCTAVDAVMVSNEATSLTLLFQNSLNVTDDATAISALLLDPMGSGDVATACAAYSEQPLASAEVMSNNTQLFDQLAYQSYAGHVESQAYWIADAVAVIDAQGLSVVNQDAYNGQELPALCTQSVQTSDQPGYSPQPGQYNITVSSGDTYQGTRSKKAFWFSGIRYAAFPGRFHYSSVYAGTGEVVSALTYGEQCIQSGGGSEDCFFLNIETPYIPRQGSTDNLRPILFWIHGGGFTGGSGAGWGGQVASREDIVTVSINYRLGTYGFMAVPGYLNGNYGLGDQATALQWVIDHIAQFGGDPKRITIAGQSAGAGSVRVMLGSPVSIGNFQGAIAMSNLGFDTSLGIGSGYGTTYSTYDTIAQSYATVGQNLFSAIGCTQDSLEAQVRCLETTSTQLNASSLPTARYPVQDGVYINTPQLLVGSKNDNVAHVPVIFGIATDDGGSFISYNTSCVTELDCLQSDLSISQAYAQQVIGSGLFPFPDSASSVSSGSVNVSSRVNTDLTFRCIDSATVFAGSQTGAFQSAYYYESERGYPEDSYNPNNLNDEGAVSMAFLLGNPETPYYKLHSSDLPSLFGTLSQPRDASDIEAIALTSGLFASFIRSGQPNPDLAYLRVRNYTSTLEAVQQEGQWSPVSSSTGPIKLLDYPAVTSDFIDQAQCAFLNASISYLLASATPSASTAISPSAVSSTVTMASSHLLSTGRLSSASRPLCRAKTSSTGTITLSSVKRSSHSAASTSFVPSGGVSSTSRSVCPVKTSSAGSIALSTLKTSVSSAAVSLTRPTAASTHKVVAWPTPTTTHKSNTANVANSDLLGKTGSSVEVSFRVSTL